MGKASRDPNKLVGPAPIPWHHIGTLGHAGHGKTTLTAALQKFDNSFFKGPFLSYEELKAASNPRADGDIPAVWISYRSISYKRLQMDYPSDAAHLPRLISALPQLDGAILVVSAVEGPMPQTRDHLLLARHFGVPALVVFLNMIDLVDSARVDQVEQQVRELLNAYFPGNRFPILRGSALAMLVGTTPEIGEDVLPKLDSEVDEIGHREVSTDHPFLMPIEDVFDDGGRQCAMGRVEAGTLQVGQAPELIGLAMDIKTLVATDVKIFGEILGLGDMRCVSVQAGHHAKIVVRGILREDLKRGQVLANPSLLRAYDGFKASVYFLTPEEGAPDRVFYPESLCKPRSQPLEVPEGLTEEEIAEYLREPTNDRPLQFHLHTAQVTGVTRYIEDSENRAVVAMPGDTLTVTVELAEPVALWKDLRFVITEEGRTVGIGTVTKLGLR